VWEIDEHGVLLYSHEVLQLGAIAHIRGLRFPITNTPAFRPGVSDLPRNLPYLFELHALGIEANSLRAVQHEETVASELGFASAEEMRIDLSIEACVNPLDACRNAALLTDIGHTDCDVQDLLRDLCTVWPTDGDAGGEDPGLMARRRANAHRTELALASLTATGFLCPVTGERIVVPVSCPAFPNQVLSLRGMVRTTLGAELSGICASNITSTTAAQAGVCIDPSYPSSGKHFLDLRLHMPAVRALVRMRCTDVHASENDHHFRKLMAVWMLHADAIADGVPSAWQKHPWVPAGTIRGGYLLRASGLTASEVWCRSLAALDAWCKRNRVQVATQFKDHNWKDPRVVDAVRKGAILLAPQVRVMAWCGDSLQLCFPEDERRLEEDTRVLEEALDKCRAKLTEVKTVFL